MSPGLTVTVSPLTAEESPVGAGPTGLGAVPAACAKETAPIRIRRLGNTGARKEWGMGEDSQGAKDTRKGPPERGTHG
ncbi:hypothetical protein DAERI_090032 [Deinococcus aerius]|uniref:Uncharacterized protein n=1 Tax=Deinococcus aerius TaxID=200253 RepID=A0A2I9D6U4_9DEIO|nr:hypothetical protein DAERI_090032 [Deinococcus aerius]